MKCDGLHTFLFIRDGQFLSTSWSFTKYKGWMTSLLLQWNSKFQLVIPYMISLIHENACISISVIYHGVDRKCTAKTKSEIPSFQCWLVSLSFFLPSIHTKGARISDRIGHSRLKSGRIGPDNIPDFPENPDLSGFWGFLSQKMPVKHYRHLLSIKEVISFLEKGSLTE